MPRSCRDVTRGPAAHRTPGPARPIPARRQRPPPESRAYGRTKAKRCAVPYRPLRIGLGSARCPDATITEAQANKHKRRLSATSSGSTHAPARARPCSGPPCIAPRYHFCRISREPNPIKNSTTKLVPPVKRTQSRPADTFSPRAPYGTASAAITGKINVTWCFPRDTESQSL